MGNDPTKTGEENLNELVHKIIRANWFRNDMIPRVKRKSTKVMVWDKKTRSSVSKLETVRGTGNWKPGNDGIIVTESRKKLNKEPNNVRNSQYVYVKIYKKIHRGKDTGNYRLVSDAIYMQYGEDPSTGKLYWIPVPRTSLPGKLMEFGTKSILDSNSPYKKAFPFSSEQEAMDYVDSVLNGDVNRQKVLDKIEDTQEKGSKEITSRTKKVMEIMMTADPAMKEKLVGAFLKMKADKIEKAIKKAETIQPTSEVEVTTAPAAPINIYAGTRENVHLSNFANRPFKIGEDTFNTVEGAFQAAKIAHTSTFTKTGKMNAENKVIFNKLKTATGVKAKSIGRKITELDVNEWNKVSANRMKTLIKQSFEQNPDALQKLLATGNAELTHKQDKSKWGKEFPRILMEVRDELRTEAPAAPSKQRDPSMDKMLRLFEQQQKEKKKNDDNSETKCD
tara:strand:- start:824 stop:2170 length:1347 start_codon:yes stop_codon:yes gene_type:complete